MQKVARVIDRVSIAVGRIVVWFTLLAVVIITFEVVARYVFDKPTNWAHESMTLIFAMQYILAGAYNHYLHAHVRVDVLYQSLSVRNRARMDLLTSLLFFFYLGIMTWTAWGFFWDSWLIREVSFTDWAPPLYPVKFSVFVGTLLLLLQGVANFLRDLKVALGRVAQA